MQTLNVLLDKARKNCPSDSDNSLSKQIGVSRSAVSVWRRGGQITNEHLMALIDLAKADPALATKVREEASETEVERRAWATLWDRLSAAAAVVALVVLTIGTVPAAHQKKTIEINGLHGSGADKMYLM
ncbi:DUF3693 domain-containing protein [Xanthomonas sp. CFBP 8445]|uniref:DUF3693 domain-containing protein n=1 Tax=Xanthomonas sp. CFBP 8445 TaxID=2971236 RepID=UPI0021E0E0E7|nr:DUF3693 domain-containing protein [Xanthomonas sp. CFBP 8445]UYC14008.1 DUF3693 domain-containing protein [Xanthomonas sp. CFBP 8445]